MWSSAAARSTPPPQVMNPPTFSAMRLSFLASFLMLAMTSIVSAVPAGLVIARDEVFGIKRPVDVTIGMTSIVVLLPGTPPMQCLSRTIFLPKLRREPCLTIDLVNSAVSELLRPWT